MLFVMEYDILNQENIIKLFIQLHMQVQVVAAGASYYAGNQITDIDYNDPDGK